MAAAADADLATPKKHKKDKSAKKRAREEEQTGSERKHKRSKSVAPEDEVKAEVEDDATEVKKVKKEKKDKKEKKHKKPKVEETNGAEATGDDVATSTIVPSTPPTEEKKKKKKSKRHEEEAANGLPEEVNGEKKKKKKSKRDEPEETEPQEPTDEDAMDVDTPAKPTGKSSSKVHSPPDMPPDPAFPFFNQTVSLYEPLLPAGWGAPITGCENQHLRHLHNRYVPSLRGVLLDYSRVTLGQKPGRAGADVATADSDVALLRSKSEFGGGFGWITADVRLFIPSRGAWMEGSVNLQTEGHVGVVCFGKFNASIEAARLPPTWTWVPNENTAEFEETASVITAGQGADEHGVKRQMHSTGYWVDEAGDKIKGRVRFRIRNFDVGTSGTSTFLSLQGTMLDRKGEKALVAKEAAEAKSRKAGKGGRLNLARKRAPEFSMTRFEPEEEGREVGEAAETTEEVPVTAEEVPATTEVVAGVTANGDDVDQFD